MLGEQESLTGLASLSVLYQLWRGQTVSVISLSEESYLVNIPRLLVYQGGPADGSVQT